MDMIAPPLGRVLDASLQRCGFSPGDTDETTCNAPATWHIAWDIHMENGLTCNKHMTYARQYAYVDRHEITPDCSMPGSSWDFDKRRCFIDGASDSKPEEIVLLVSGTEHSESKATNFQQWFEAHYVAP